MNTNRLMLITMTFAAGAAAAFACPPSDPSEHGQQAPGAVAVRRVQPLIGLTAASFEDPAQEATAVHRVMQIVKDGTNVRIEERDGRLSATMNGEAVPAERLKRDGAAVQILDKDGKVVFTHEMPAAAPDVLVGTPPTRVFRTLPGMTYINPDAAAQTVQIENGPAPKVMLGVTMDRAGEDTVEHLGLPAGAYTMLGNVYPDLPAAQAGLKARDIIVSVDGKSPASPETIREVIRTKNAGEEIRFDIVRKGERQQVAVKLAPFDAAKLRRVEAVPGVPGSFRPQMAPNGENWEQFAKRMEEMGREMEEKWGDAGRRFGDEMARRFADPEQWNMAIPRQGQAQPPIFFSTPLPPGGVADIEARLKSLEQQLQRIEDMLRQLSKERGIAPNEPVKEKTQGMAPVIYAAVS